MKDGHSLKSSRSIISAKHHKPDFLAVQQTDVRDVDQIPVETPPEQHQTLIKHFRNAHKIELLEVLLQKRVQLCVIVHTKLEGLNVRRHSAQLKRQVAEGLRQQVEAHP